MCAEDMNNERDDGKVTKESFKDYTYVMVSTLNQMVNYIPLKHFTFKEVVNITVEENKENKEKPKENFFNNNQWDKNLKTIYKDTIIIDMGIEKNNFFDLTLVKNKLIQEIDTGKLQFQKIFWNITGGQRHILMAINQVVKDGDKICYLEGNNNQMMIYDVATQKTECIEYSLNLEKDLTIETALKLMGFDLRSIEKKEGKDTERQFYLDFYDKYTDEKNVSLRKALINLNKTKNPNCSSITDTILTTMKLCEHTTEDFTKQYPFGYILEKLAFYQFEKIVSTNKALVVHSLKIIFDDEDVQKEINHKTIDEFDIALLTKNGKFMIFECKSGGMSGDVAKSTNYSTYAVSGVYGLPILITPLLASEISNLNTLGEEYETIKSAVKSAKRASLEVWGIDEIATKIEKYIG
jgi:hypothetical protein